MEIIWSPTARTKIDDIVDYISPDNLDAAIDLVDEFKNRVRNLMDHPRLGRVVRALNDEMVRELVVHQNYLIIYEINENRIIILTIRHAKQDEEDFDTHPD